MGFAFWVDVVKGSELLHTLGNPEYINIGASVFQTQRSNTNGAVSENASAEVNFLTVRVLNSFTSRSPRSYLTLPRPVQVINLQHTIETSHRAMILRGDDFSIKKAIQTHKPNLANVFNLAISIYSDFCGLINSRALPLSFNPI